MKGGSGSGPQPVALEYGRILFLQNGTVTGAPTATSFVLPQGSWWRLELVSLGVDNSTPAAANDIDLSADLGQTRLLRQVIPTAVPAGTFDGQVSFGIGLDPNENATTDCVTVPLPDTHLPGGTIVNVSCLGADPTATFITPILIARAVMNLAGH